MITPNSWKVQFEAALKKGQEGLDEAVGLYLWARDHLKESHLVDHEYNQEDTAIRIAQVWNMSVDTYCRTVSRLGNGSDVASVNRGRAIVKKFGLFETFRAERQLGLDQMQKLVDRLPELAGPSDLHKAVDDLRSEMDSIQSAKDKKERKPERMDLRKEAEYWRQRAIEMEQKCKMLQKELNWFKSHVEIRASTTA
jgi:hypothetical protein